MLAPFAFVIIRDVDSLPRVVDRYELLSVLGSGGFATVYRAQHVHTQQPVAVKILAQRSGADRWLTEARAAAAVQHRNVVRVLDCGRSGDDVFIVMDLVSGPTLADVLAQTGALPPQRAIGIAVQILDGLAVAHARSIVHRDIKPPNILLTQDADGSDFPKILDFGVSKQLTEVSSTLDGTAIGTPGYMAPELFGGARYADPRVDIYALAATLYEMLSGKLPFAARTYEELVVQVATTRPAPLLTVAPHVGPEIAAAVDRGLARDREARWQTAEQFASALRGALMGIAPPSSDGFQATLYATNVPMTPLSPRVPTLAVPEPSTLRTAPPPVVSTASRNETRSSGALPWVIGILGVALLASVGGALVAWRVLRPSVNAPAPVAVAAATTSTTSVATSPPRENDDAVPSASPTQTQAAVTPSATSNPKASHPSTPASPLGIAFKFPAETVGQVSATSVDSLSQLVAAKAQRCRPDHGSPPVRARVLFHVHDDGNIALPAPASDPGDVATARCLATFFKETASPKTFNPGGSGIVTVEARLDPR